MFHGVGKIPMTFIRAPYITQVSDDVTVLATIDGNIVAARQGNQLVTAFHPELDDATDVHEYFCKIIGG
jgi:5'-phosphate synthase pdxT subunit